MKYERPLVPRPCLEDWDKLTPEERGHFCTVCETKVWDLSSLTAEEAAAFLRESEGDLCVSYRERAGGEVVHREEPPPQVVPLARLMRRMPAAAGFSLALAACTPSGQGPQPNATANEPPTEPVQPAATAEPKPDPEGPESGESGDEPAPTTAVIEPEDPPEIPPEERHVKGKWAAPEDAPDRGEKPVIKKGKVARPD